MITFNCKYTAPALEAIARTNEALAVKIDAQGCFIRTEDVQPLIDIDPAMEVLVRCYTGRFRCTIKSLNWHLKAIENGCGRESGLRDVCIPIPKGC